MLMRSSISVSGILLIFIGIADVVRTANILALFPSQYKSHFILGKVVFTELANRGHTITLISQFTLDKPHKHDSITEIKLEGVQDHFHDVGLEQEPYVHRGDQSTVTEIINLIYGTTTLVNYTLSYPKVQEIIRSEQKFDLLLIDMYFMDALLGLAYYWNIPAVVLCSSGTNKWANEMVGNPHNPAFNPSMFLGYTDKMSLKQRLLNSLASAFEKITYNYMYLPSQEVIYLRYFRNLINKNVELPPLIDLIHNVSLILVNSHPAIQYPRPSTPNMVQVGGMHILSQNKDDLKDVLAQHIDEYITAAPEGVIYMSLGTLVKSADLPIEKITAFVNVFQKYVGKMRIIWKWENATLINHPHNVIVGPYMPQAAILAHPKVRLFITNGGALSILEAIHFETPIVGIPIYGDQHFNVAQAEENGLGRKIDFHNITEESVTETLAEVLNNPMYHENAVRLNKLLQDNPVDPLELAIFNIEYVLRTNGSRHFRSPAVDLSMWQQSLVDVSLIITAGILLILGVPSFFICLVLRKSNNASGGSGGAGGGGGGGKLTTNKMLLVTTTPKRHKKKQQ